MDNSEEMNQSGDLLSSMRQNPWKPATLVLVLIVAGLVIFGNFSSNSGLTGNVVKEDVAAKNLLEFLTSQGASDTNIISIDKESGMYKIIVGFNGQQAPIYVTLDGQYAIPQTIPITGSALDVNPDAQTQQTQKEVPKSAKPRVELFIMSYCPYGTQMEKGFLPVIDLLGNKINASIEYTHFILHGEKENTENFRQMCIRNEQPSKFYSYLQCTLNSTSVSAPADVNACMKKLGIDVTKVNDCITNRAEKYYAVDSALSESYGVQGSPTLVINGVQVQSGRSPAAILESVCSAFTNEPSECSKQLATDSPSPGFGYNSGSAADLAAANCGV
jgi:hypothetical protein